MKDMHHIRGFMHQLLTDIEEKELKPVGLRVVFDTSKNVADGAIELDLNGQRFRLLVEAPCNCGEVDIS